MKNFLIILLILVVSSCDKSLKLEDSDEIYRSKLSEIVFDTPVVKNNLIQLFDIDGNSPKVFKILISRKDHFTRITITQIFYKFEIEELPFSYIKYKKNIFLYYNGTEMILKKSIGKDELNKMLFELNIELEDSSSIYDSRILQFDLFVKGEIKINNPPINPYDESEEGIKFVPKIP